VEYTTVSKKGICVITATTKIAGKMNSQSFFFLEVSLLFI
jgi:hypothetical protein